MNDARQEKERQVLRFIDESVKMRGYPPSRREIAEHVGWSSPGHVNEVLRVLAARGLIRLDPNIPRGIQVTTTGMVAMTETV
jgi:repressor LexA